MQKLHSEIYVGKKAERGVVGSTDPIIPGVLNTNATSGSVNKINGIPANQFSPMYLGPVNKKEIFEKEIKLSLYLKDTGNTENSSKNWDILMIKDI